MRSRRRAGVAILLIGTIVWLGGLLRMGIWAVPQGIAAVAHTPTERDALVIAVLLCAVVSVLLLRMQWIRRAWRQLQVDVHMGYFGHPPHNPALPVELTMLRVGRLVATIVLPAVVLAFVLPGPAEGAIAAAAGLVVRLGAAALLSLDGT